MSQPAQPTKSPSTQIELEPLGGDVVTAHNPVHHRDWTVQLTGDNGRQIPDRPGHNCPDCGFDLRSLTGRICPECGREFTISEARYAGLTHDPRAVTDVRAIRMRRYVLFASFAAFVVAFFAPFLAVAEWPTFGTITIQLLIALPFVGLAMAFNHAYAAPNVYGFAGAAIFFVLIVLIEIWVIS